MMDYELLNKAKFYSGMDVVYVSEVFIKRDSVLYDGMWGRNGYNNIEVAFKLNDNYYKTPRYNTDVLHLTTINDKIGIDCPHNCKYIRLFTYNDKYHFRLALGLSTIDISLVNKEVV